MTRYGKLCGQPTSTAPAGEFAFPNFTFTAPNGEMAWAQMGYRRTRVEGTTQPQDFLYAELGSRINGADTVRKLASVELAPGEGTTHTYRCDLDETTGKCFYFYDDIAWGELQLDYWKNKFGTSLEWKGEIVNKQDDMPGTAADKCRFTDCQYREIGEQYHDAGLEQTRVTSDDPEEWGAEWVSGTAFNIWDKKPL